jgi:putative transposase
MHKEILFHSSITSEKPRRSGRGGKEVAPTGQQVLQLLSNHKYSLLESMKLVANLKLTPTDGQHEALLETLRTANCACNWLSGQAWESHTFGQFALHKLAYKRCREQFGLAAQMTVRCIAKVADAYKLDRKTRRRFQRYAAQPYDDRIFRLCSDTHLSLWTVQGRMTIAYQCGERQRALLPFRKGEVDLLYIKGVFYLAVVCDVLEPEELGIERILGVDFGIVNLAVDSDGTVYSGAPIEQKRQRLAQRRHALQYHRTRAARRKLRQLQGKQARFQQDTNHCIAKRLVDTTQRSAAGIALEDLTGIRQRVKARRPQRPRHANWSFAQLRQYVTYKAALAGVPLILVDARHTSQECNDCGYIAKANRPSQDRFSWQRCGYTTAADLNAAQNIKNRAAVNRRMVAGLRQLRLALA